MSNSEKLDHFFATIDDYLNSRDVRQEELDQTRSLDTTYLQFNKPGFDLAIIITDACLIKSIQQFQVPFQSKYGLTTHVIYLPDVSRIKFCIRDLKLADILYAIVVNKNSEKDDDFDAYVLNPNIERQRRMNHKEMVELIVDDFTNYQNESKKLIVNPEKYPHARNKHMEGFIEPPEDVRYHLCLLFDHRMLNRKQLVGLKRFIDERKEAIRILGNRQVNYGMSDRPVPPYRQEKSKYYVYECKLPLQKENPNIIVNEVCAPVTAVSRCMEISNVTAVNTDKPLVTPNSVATPLALTDKVSKAAIIAASPKLYSKINPKYILDNPSTIIASDIPLPPDVKDIKHVSQQNKTISIKAPALNLFIQSNKKNAVLATSKNINIVESPTKLLNPKGPSAVEIGRINKICIQDTSSMVGTSPCQISPDVKEAPVSLSGQSNYVNLKQCDATPVNKVNMVISNPPKQIISPLETPFGVTQPHNLNITSKTAAQICDIPDVVPPLISPLSPQISEEVLPVTSSTAKVHDNSKVSVTRKRKIQFSISSSSKQPLLSHSNVANKHSQIIAVPTNVTVSKDIVREIHRPIPEIESVVNCPIIILDNSPEKEKNINSVTKSVVSDVPKDRDDIWCNLSPISDEPDNIQIDLTDDIIEEVPSSPPSKKCKFNSPQNTPSISETSEFHSTDPPKVQNTSQPPSQTPVQLSAQLSPQPAAQPSLPPVTQPSLQTAAKPSLQPSLKPPVQFSGPKMSCNVFKNLLKFILNLSPLSLPAQNVVMLMIKKCIADMEVYITNLGLKADPINLQSVKVNGCTEIINIIQSLCDEQIFPKENLVDLNYMWQFFPRNLSLDSITVLFYKLMKMIELSKLVTISNSIFVNMLQSLQNVVHYNFQLGDINVIPSSYLNYFPSMFNEYFNLKDELHNLNLVLPPPEPISVVFNTDIDKTIVENKIKFVVGPLMEYFINVINSLHYDLDIETMEVVYNSIRSLRFCLRKICNKIISEVLQKPIAFITSEDIIDRTLALLDEINFALREVNMMNCILFTKKHYDFINLILDFSMKIERAVEGDTEADLDSFDKKVLIHIVPAQFVQEFASTIKTAVFPYHPDTEIEVLKDALRNRWVDVLHQAFRGVPPEPDGWRLSKEVVYLLPRQWGRRAFEEAVVTAAGLCAADWERMLQEDLAANRLLYTDVRNNYLLWLARHRLDHRRATELMTASQKRLDATILRLADA